MLGKDVGNKLVLGAFEGAVDGDRLGRAEGNFETDGDTDGP